MIYWTNDSKVELDSAKTQAIKATYPILIGWMLWACYAVWILN